VEVISLAKENARHRKMANAHLLQIAHATLVAAPTSHASIQAQEIILSTAAMQEDRNISKIHAMIA
jgi:hypothetical protein